MPQPLAAAEPEPPIAPVPVHTTSTMRPRQRATSAWRRSTTSPADELPLLPFQCIACDGGAYGVDYDYVNILSFDDHVYCSTKPRNVNLLFKFFGAGSFELTAFTVRAPAAGFTAPCYDGLLFVSHNPLTFAETSEYDGWTEATYTAHEASAADGGKQTNPAAYFKLGHIYSTTVHLNAPRTGRYVLLKLLRPVRGDNIDIQFVGFHGRRGPQSFALGSLC